MSYDKTLLTNSRIVCAAKSDFWIEPPVLKSHKFTDLNFKLEIIFWVNQSFESFINQTKVSWKANNSCNMKCNHHSFHLMEAEDGATESPLYAKKFFDLLLLHCRKNFIEIWFVLFCWGEFTQIFLCSLFDYYKFPNGD